MIVLEKIKSTGRQVISFVVVMVHLAFTKWISHVNQFLDHFILCRKSLKDH